jgi:hypothetical protein
LSSSKQGQASVLTRRTASRQPSNRRSR